MAALTDFHCEIFVQVVPLPSCFPRETMPQEQ